MAERRQRTRDELIELVRYGNLKPADAEAEAAARGWRPFAFEPPLPAFDPMQVSRWSIVMAIAWIAWRDLGLVREQQPEFRAECTHWLFRHWREPTESGASFRERSGWFLEPYRPSSTARLSLQEAIRKVREPEKACCMSIREAQAALWQALSDGALVAIGINPQQEPVDIPERDWTYLKLFEERERDAVKLDSLDRREAYTDIRLKRDDLLRLWRQATPIATDPATGFNVEPYMLKPVSEPGNSGFVPLCAAIQWIMTNSGTRTVALDAPEWNQSVSELWPKVCSDDIDLIGLATGDPRASRIPGHTMTLVKVFSPLHNALSDILLNSSSHVACTPFVDQPHWEQDLNDKLYETGRAGPAWSHLQVRKSQLLAHWPRSVSASNVEQDCYRWLFELMQASPKEKPKPRSAFWDEACGRFPKLKQRQFMRVWQRAVADSGAQWSKAGRSKKSNRGGN